MFIYKLQIIDSIKDYCFEDKLEKIMIHFLNHNQVNSLRVVTQQYGEKM